MSRSRRKTPMKGFAGGSEKWDKQSWHRNFRRTNKIRVRIGLEPVEIREISDLWLMNKDGKMWFAGFKDAELESEWMRK